MSNQFERCLEMFLLPEQSVSMVNMLSQKGLAQPTRDRRASPFELRQPQERQSPALGSLFAALSTCFSSPVGGHNCL